VAIYILDSRRGKCWEWVRQIMGTSIGQRYIASIIYCVVLAFHSAKTDMIVMMLMV